MKIGYFFFPPPTDRPAGYGSRPSQAFSAAPAPAATDAMREDDFFSESPGQARCSTERGIPRAASGRSFGVSFEYFFRHPRPSGYWGRPAQASTAVSGKWPATGEVASISFRRTKAKLCEHSGWAGKDRYWSLRPPGNAYTRSVTSTPAGPFALWGPADESPSNQQNSGEDFFFGVPRPYPLPARAAWPRGSPWPEDRGELRRYATPDPPAGSGVHRSVQAARAPAAMRRDARG